MQGKVLALMLLLVATPLAGCVGGDDKDDKAVEPTGADDDIPEVVTGPDGAQYNTTANATYLENSDYVATHDHNYWGGKTELVVMDENVPVYGGLRCREGPGCLTSIASRGWGAAEFTLPNGSIVPEGTGKVIVEMDATAALLAGSNIEFGYSPRGYGGEWNYLSTASPTATFEIEIAPEMADLPHASSSQWFFRALAGQGTAFKATFLGTDVDPYIHFLVTVVHVYDIAAWPAHPDFWSGGKDNRLDLLNETVAFDIQRVAPMRWLDMDDQEQGVVHFAEGVLVPPETQALVVSFAWTLSSAPENTLVTGMDAAFKLGSSSGYFVGGWCYEIEDESTPGSKLYVIPVDETSWDSPYAAASSWAFAIDPSVVFFTDQVSVEKASGEASFDIQAYRELPAWVDEAIEEDVRCFYDDEG